MRRSFVDSFVIVALLLLALVIGSVNVPSHETPADRPTALPRANATDPAAAKTPTLVMSPTPEKAGSLVATRPSPATPVTPTPIALTSPAAATNSATPLSTPTSQPTPTPLPAPSLVQQSNGMKIGCAPGVPDQYLTCEAQEPLGFAMTFYLYLPQGFKPGTRYPLILLLEGGGERADPTKTAAQNRLLTVADPYAQVWGPGFPGQFSQNVQGRWPSFVVIPQPVTPARFVDVPANVGSYTLATQPNDTMRMTKEIVDTLQLVYRNIDAKRIYLTGLSMGGYGAWEAAERWPSYWAAAAPIAGAGDPSKASLLVKLPIWAFHSTNDDIVPVSGSRDMIQAIEAAGGKPKYTEYPDLGHGAWLAPYAILNSPTPTPDFFTWLFAQHR